jgi:extracellular factor (EF) 3-hydroxypalmitic acid methyl ester biosynthesis protein
MATDNHQIGLSTEFSSLVDKFKTLKNEVDQNPGRWTHYLDDVIQLTLDIFSYAATLESSAQSEEMLLQYKQHFIRHFREFVRSGSLNKWVMDRPYGYAGDFFIIDQLYKNQVQTVGFEACMDTFLLNSPAAVATRNRKEDFKNIIRNFISNSKSREINIMNLACGPSRDIHELVKNAELLKKISFECIDHDDNALNYAKKLLASTERENIEFIFTKKNAYKIALSKNVEKYLNNRSYDLIYSTGLVDYFNDEMTEGLIKNLKKLLRPGGMLAISNYTNKMNNRSRLFMEWGVNWNLVHRDEADYLKLFINSGFSLAELEMKFERQGIMQYCLASPQ